MASMPEEKPTAAAVNQAIRDLWVGGTLPAERQAEYHQLLVVRAEAMRVEQELAA
ncbi:hypothetical protein ACFUJR_14645 [Streptomyces sp. NPDC057271]|uniref:hypothetical protein n=1 Tax=unclassified Streptomyces TaxID=2593676 RepID=UPI00363CD795